LSHISEERIVADGNGQEMPPLTKAATWTMSACAAHCLLTPFLAGVLPLLGLRVLAAPWFEWSMVALGAGLGGFGIWLSYARAHRQRAPGVVFLLGVTVLLATRLATEWDIIHAGGTAIAAVIMYVAGRMNHRCASHAPCTDRAVNEPSARGP
jgi:hypothetical protein